VNAAPASTDICRSALASAIHDWAICVVVSQGDGMTSSERKLAAGDILIWRWSGGGRIFGARYVLEGTDRRLLASTCCKGMGWPARIETPSRAFVCSTNRWRQTLTVFDNARGATVAHASLPNSGGRISGTISALDEYSLPFVIEKPGSGWNTRNDKLATSMTLQNPQGRVAATLRWLEARMLRKPLFLGEATLGTCDVDDDILLVLVCVAFYVFMAGVSPRGGG